MTYFAYRVTTPDAFNLCVDTDAEALWARLAWEIQDETVLQIQLGYVDAGSVPEALHKIKAEQWLEVKTSAYKED